MAKFAQQTTLIAKKGRADAVLEQFIEAALNSTDELGLRGDARRDVSLRARRRLCL